MSEVGKQKFESKYQLQRIGHFVYTFCHSLLKPISDLRLISVLFTLLLAVSVPVQAQQAKKVPRIGYLSSFDPASDSDRAEPIRLALREVGYIEGQNIASEYRYAVSRRYSLR